MPEEIHVLIGEDDANDRLLLEWVFKKVCPEVQIHLFPSGLTLLEELKTRGRFPTLVILDKLTEEMSGWKILEWLKQEPGFGNVPAIMMSGQANEADRKRAEALGVKGYFEKPCDTVDLERLVKSFERFWK